MTAGLGIDRLIDLLIDTFHWFIPWIILDHYEKGVVLRFGKFNREISAGFHWIIPFNIEDVKYENFKPDGVGCPTQTITLLDGTNLSFSVLLVWEILNVKQFILEVEDKETVTTWAMGTVQDFLQRCTWNELLEMRRWAAESGKRHGLREKLIKHVNDELEEITGVCFRDIQFIDFTKTGFKDGIWRTM